MQRMFEWTCESCGKRAVKPDYGMPKGWVYIKQMGEVSHACNECIHRLPMGTQIGRDKP